MRAEWAIREPTADAEVRLVREVGISPLLARLLVNRGLVQPASAVAFLEASLRTHLRSPMLFREMRPAAERLLKAVGAGERIAIYGDYDVDGITGATQVRLFLRALGVEPEVFIPHRLRDGYGLRAEVLRGLAGRGARLVVTADCGAASHDEIRAGSEEGLDVIVCDHHQAPDVRPPAFAVLNPVVRDAGFPFSGLSAAGVVFYLLLGTRMLLRERGEKGPDLRRYLDLVALGTVADLVPLVEENRVLVKHGLREIERTDRPGIRALLEVAGIRSVSAGAVGFGLGPRINASGRLADATQAVDLLSTGDPVRARDLARALDGYNRDRRVVDEATFEEAVGRIEAMGDADTRRSFVLSSEGWHPGVVGIVASRLVERYYRPVVLLAVEGEFARGSARGIPCVHLFEALRECASVLERYGGHRMAAGLTIRSDRVPEFASRFERAIIERTGDVDLVPVVNVDAKVDLNDVSLDMVDDLERLEPHGPGNSRPVLLAESVEVVSRRVVGERHLRLDLRAAGSRSAVPAIGFRMGERLSEASGRIDVLFCPEIDRWEGRTRLQIVFRDFRKTPERSVG